MKKKSFPSIILSVFSISIILGYGAIYAAPSSKTVKRDSPAFAQLQKQLSAAQQEKRTPIKKTRQAPTIDRESPLFKKLNAHLTTKQKTTKPSEQELIDAQIHRELGLN